MKTEPDFPPPALCPYCGNDLPPAPAHPSDAPCPHCTRVPRGLRWNLLPAGVGTPGGDVRVVFDTLAVIFLAAGVLLGALGLFGPKHPPPPGLVALLLGVGIACGVIRVFIRRSPRNAEWTFGTGDEWSGMARFRGGRISYAEGSHLREGEPIPCAPPPSASAVLTWDALRACDGATLAEMARCIRQASNEVAESAAAWVPEMGMLIGLAARGRIGWLTTKLHVEGWTRNEGQGPAPREPLELPSVVVTAREADGAEEPAFEREFLAALRAELNRQDEEIVSGYRAAAPHRHVRLDAVFTRLRANRDAPVANAPDTVALLAAWRAFTDADPLTASALWALFSESYLD